MMKQILKITPNLMNSLRFWSIIPSSNKIRKLQNIIENFR